MKAQHSAPLFWVNQYDPAAPKDFIVRLRNIGMQMRPDLFDAHTIHWHGFRNVIPFYDGEPTGLGRRAAGAGVHLRLPARATRARTCTTATSRTWSTCRWA